MKYFPTIVVDDFLETPEYWVKLASEQTYAPDPNNKWPGLRSPPLHQTNREAFDLLVPTFFSLFYDLRNTEVRWNVSACFQKIPAAYDAGWVHTDLCKVSGIVYLNNDPSPDAGTTICQPNCIWKSRHADKKRAAFSGELSVMDANNYRDDHNSQFDDSIVVKNKFNRMVAFDASRPHRASSFVTDGEDRLTLVFFIEQIHTELLPQDRIMRRLWPR